MRIKLFALFSLGLAGVIVLTLPIKVTANTPLTRAEIQSIRNFVQLIPKVSKNKRPARPADAMTPGDGLSTGRASLADLRFNDGSLARVGEQAVFQFTPQTRNFRLANGTVLLLIPPGKGQTRIQTPSATAAIRGSALFIRYDQKTDTTIIGALTNSGIAVSNKDGSQTQGLEAGQLLVMVKGEFQSLYDFDLANFYETSDLTKGLNLTRQNPSATTDPAIASVQAEIIAALASKAPVSGQGVIENPTFLELTPNSSVVLNPDTNLGNSEPELNPNQALVDSLIQTGEILFNNAQETANNLNNTINNQVNNVRTINTEENTNPGGENTNPGGGNTNPGGGNTNPGGGNTSPGGGNTNPGGGNTNPGGGNTNPGGGRDHNPGGGGNPNPGGDRDHNPGGGGNPNPGGGRDHNPGGGGNPNPGGSGNTNPGGGNTNPGGGRDHNPGIGGNPNSSGGGNPNPGGGRDHNPGGGGNPNPGGGGNPNPGGGGNFNPSGGG